MRYCHAAWVTPKGLPVLAQVLDTGHLPHGGKTLWINDLKGAVPGLCMR